MIPQKKLSKFLSLILRHRPEVVNLNMDENGWVNLEELIEKMNAHGKPVNLAAILEVVKNNDKQRFKIDDAGQKIRANQGHSKKVDLALQPQNPPATLYHGTATKNLTAIQKSGLQKMNRQHVHLSSDLETATKVGSRHGKVIILEIDCFKMSADGLEFYLSENKVWLTDHVPLQYIKF